MLSVALKKLWYRIYAGLFIRQKAGRKKFRKEKILAAERKYLQKYLYVLDKVDYTVQSGKEKKKIWVCWFQGEANAPEIVKRTIASIRRNANGCEVVLLDDGNIKKYADIPDYIWEKRENGKITPMQFSDILRAALLADSGGIWIDSTVLLTAPLSDLFINSDFFCMQSKGIYRNVNWIIASSCGNPLMVAEKLFLFEYWKYENRLIDYFLYPLAFDLLVDNSGPLQKLWKKVPVFCEDGCYLLEKNYFSPYSEKLLKEICAKTSIHKLSYKYDKKREIKGTLLEKLLTLPEK